MDHALLSHVLVYRGQPSAEHDPRPYARNQAQKAHWERDQRVTVAHRPLKYRYERDTEGRLVLGADGRRVVESKGEKGIDVLCALAVVREAQRPDVDLVILASHDSDLEPCRAHHLVPVVRRCAERRASPCYFSSSSPCGVTRYHSPPNSFLFWPSASPGALSSSYW